MQKEKQEVRLTSEQEKQLQVIDARITYVKGLRYYTAANKQRRIERLELLRSEAVLFLLTPEYMTELIAIARLPVDATGTRINREWHIGDYHTIQDYEAISKALCFFEIKEK